MIAVLLVEYYDPKSCHKVTHILTHIPCSSFINVAFENLTLIHLLIL
jgi:hypothetical protein